MRSLLVLLVLAAGAGAVAVPATAAPPSLTASVVGEPPRAGGVFRFPQAVAFSPGGSTVFVADQYSDVVQAFTADGTPRFSFGERAIRGETGRLGAVGGVATDRGGHLYVLDSENNRVQIFSAADGRFLSSFGNSSVFHLNAGSGVGEGISAGGLAVVQPDAAVDPVVYVADAGNDRIERFTLDAATLAPTGAAAISPSSFGGESLSFPQGIALDPAGSRLYVADDDNNRVVVLDPQTFAFEAQVGSAGTGPGQFQNPYDVAVDAHQPSQLYVADNLNNRVDVFDAATLAFRDTFGGYGHSVGSFSIVRSVGALGDDPRGGVDVADTANNRIQALDPGGALLGAWGLAGRGPGYTTRPSGVAFAPGGGVSVADTFDHRVERFDADGNYSSQFGLVSRFTGFPAPGSASGQFDAPMGVTYDSTGKLWVADTANNRIVEIDPASGAVVSTSAAGQFSGPEDVTAGPAGSVYVADTGNGRVVQESSGGSVTPVTAGLAHPAAVAFDGHATVYAADDTRVLDAGTGSLIPAPGESAWDHPDGLAVDPASGTLYVSERRLGVANGARVERGAPDGNGGFTWDTIASEGSGDGQVIDPAGLGLSPDAKTLLVADRGNDRVLRLDAPGHPAPVTQPLSVTVSGITAGSVTSDLPGISCATDCIQHFGAGRTVTLTAAASGGDAFLGWTGACAPAGGSPRCTLTMSGPQNAGASFGSPAGAPAPGGSVAGGGPGPGGGLASAGAPVPSTTGPGSATGLTSAPGPGAFTPSTSALLRLHLSTHRLHRSRPRDLRHHRPAQPATRALVSVALVRSATLTVEVQVGRPGKRRGSQCLPPAGLGRHNCTRFVTTPGQRVLRLAAGTGGFHLTPSWAGRALAPGTYRLAIVALDQQGHRVGPFTATFAVTR
jgi:YVTN family beta-propeller protein